LPQHTRSPARSALFEELRRILLEAIAAGGSTISDYRNAYGKSGIFQDSFQVYGKKGQPCPACGRALAGRADRGKNFDALSEVSEAVLGWAGRIDEGWTDTDGHGRAQTRNLDR
jgi:hypothetical protein